MGEKIAAGPRQGAAAGEEWQRYSATSARRHRDGAWLNLRRALRKHGGRPVKLTVDVKPTAAALVDPVIGPHAMPFLLECGASAHLGGDAECFGCLARWAPDRTVKAIGLVCFLAPAGLNGLVGLCGDCCGDRNILRLVAAGFERDLGLTGLTVLSMAQAGHA